LVCRAFTFYTAPTFNRGVHSNDMFFPTILDMANCRQREQGAPNPVRVRNRVALDWTRPGWSRANGRIGFTTYVVYRARYSRSSCLSFLQ
jgi:hypothetical protein